MTVAKINLALIFVSLAVLGACGSPGEPLPPSLELARPVSDLRALRKGNTVILTSSIGKIAAVRGAHCHVASHKQS
jgi:hypothetical protein